MPFNSSEKAGSGGFKPVPTGSHIARCVTVVDLGVQQTPWGSKEQVYLGFEVPGFRVEWEKDEVQHEGPGLIGVTWTNNLYEEANLGKNLISWRGKPFSQDEKKGFDLFNLLGVPCMISVTHNESKNGKVYANISSIMGVPSGMDVPKQETDSLGYTAADSAYSGTLDKLPEWLKQKALDGQRQTPAEPRYPEENRRTIRGFRPYAGDSFDDDIPFDDIPF
jgi:hypothetical protein